MKMTIEQLEKKYEAAKKAEAAALAYIDEQTDNIVQLKQKEAEAAAADNLEKYQELKRQRSNLEDLVFVKQASLKNLFNPQDVYDTWNGYAAGYNKELARREKEIDKAIMALKDLFTDIVQFQNNALAARERCGDLLGIGYSDLDHAKLEKELQMDYINSPTGLEYSFGTSINGTVMSYHIRHSIPAFLGAMNLVSNEEIVRMCDILQLHLSRK